jgi:predicted dinucleotide-binding enzyme
MSYAIVGFGKIGQALAHAFARKNINVTVASRRPPEALAPQARAIGPTVVARSLQDALEADTIILAVPFGEHREVAKAMPSWKASRLLVMPSHTNLGSRSSSQSVDRNTGLLQGGNYEGSRDSGKKNRQKTTARKSATGDGLPQKGN